MLAVGATRNVLGGAVRGDQRPADVRPGGAMPTLRTPPAGVSSSTSSKGASTRRTASAPWDSVANSVRSAQFSNGSTSCDGHTRWRTRTRSPTCAWNRSRASRASPVPFEGISIQSAWLDARNLLSADSLEGQRPAFPAWLRHASRVARQAGCQWATGENCAARGITSGYGVRCGRSRGGSAGVRFRASGSRVSSQAAKVTADTSTIAPMNATSAMAVDAEDSGTNDPTRLRRAATAPRIAAPMCTRSPISIGAVASRSASSPQAAAPSTR